MSDLRFTSVEAAAFFNQVMGLHLAAEDIRALEERTEGWVVGLQMAALALQSTEALSNGQGAANFVQAFTGSDRYTLDYLVEEVLDQQPGDLRDFLLYTAILDRLNGPLCDALRREAVRRGLDRRYWKSSNAPTSLSRRLIIKEFGIATTTCLLIYCANGWGITSQPWRWSSTAGQLNGTSKMAFLSKLSAML